MCGIAATWRDPGRCVQIMNHLEHRGTTDLDIRTFGNWTLGRVRLPINGVGERQFDGLVENEDYVYAYVGEVFNHHELFGPPEHDDERCDLANVVLAFEESGFEACTQFDGFWSIIMLHKHTQTLIAITDYLCQKPLYFDTQQTAVASEVRPLTKAYPDPEWNMYYLGQCMKFGYPLSNATYDSRVFKMRRSHLIKWNYNGEIVTDGMYEDILARRRPCFSPSEEAIEHFRRLMTRSTRSRCMSDVPIALLLSGGLDSSIVYHDAIKQSAMVMPVHVENDEREALDALELARCEHVAIDVDKDAVPALQYNDGPVDLGSMVPQYALGRAVRKLGYSVSLAGDGADELFGGYGRTRDYDSQLTDVFDELVNYHLPRLDKLMMAHTIEHRSPFLARDVIAFALSLPYEWRIDKRWLRYCYRGILPDSIVNGEKRALRTNVVHNDRMAWTKQLKEQLQTNEEVLREHYARD